jgi:hypothetical protein
MTRTLSTIQKNRSTLKPFFTLIICTIAVLLLNGCEFAKKFEGKNEGVIVYEISFPLEKPSVLLDLYPKEMLFHFKGNLMHSEIRSSYDILNSDFIIDNDKRSLIQMLKNMSQRSYMELDEQSVGNWLTQFGRLRYEPTSETITIAGYICEKTLAHFEDTTIPPITLYHSKGLGLSNDNWWNQYSGIDGFLFGYEVEQFGKRMRFMAKEVKFEPVDKTEFTVPNNYKHITSDEMNAQLKNVVEEFM